MKALIKRIRRLLDTRRIRGQLRRVISIVACIVVFATTYALVLPAITMEAVARCGKEAHEHTAGCYEKVLICREPEADGHHHTDDCYRIEKVLDCNMEEHTHGPECRDAEGNLICENAEHIHVNACYREERELICGLEESEGHHHTDACYENRLVCGKEVHIHSPECYENDEPASQDDFFAGGDPAGFTEDNSAGSTFADDGFTDDGSADSEFSDNDFSDGGITFSDSDQEFTEPDGFDGADEFIEDAGPEDGSGFMETQGLEDGTVFEDPAYAEDGSYPEDPAADNQYDDTAYIEEIDDGAVPAAAGETLEDENADPAAADAETPDGTEAVNPDEAGVSTEAEENALNGDSSGQTIEEQNPDGSAAADIEAADIEKEAQNGEEAGEAGTEKTAEADSPDAAAKDGKTAQDGATEQDGKTTQDGAAADTEKTGTASDKENTDGTDAASDKEKADGKETDAAEADTALTDQTGADKEQDSFAAADQLQAPADLERFLTDRTGIWYYPAVFNEDGKADTADINSESVTDWKKVEDDTVLSPEDFVRIYLAYTLPAGTLSETNPVARYTLPANLHLTPAQIEAINTHENGYYLSLGEDDVQAEVEQVKETLEDPADSPSEEDFAPGDQNAEEAIPSEEANAAAGPDVQGTERQDYLGAEAVEGNRTPGQPLNDQKEEYISAVVKAEEIYDESGSFLGQELVFTFLPYTVEKNKNVYADTAASASTDNAESSDELIRKGKAVTGFLTIDFATGQIDFADTETENIKTAEITFAHENETEGIGFIRESLTMDTSVDFRKAQETRAGQDNEEKSGSGKTEEMTPEDKTADGENNTSDKKDADKEENEKAVEDGSGDGSDKEASDKEGTELPADAMPARTFEDSITLETARPASVGETGTIAEAAGTLSSRSEVRVRVEADEGTFPAGTTMVLSAVSARDMDAVAEAVESAVVANADTENKANGGNAKSPQTCGFQAVDISFRDADGNEIEPAKPVRVVMTSSLIKEAAQNDTISAPVVVHVDNKGNGEQIDLVDPEKIEAAKGRTEEELIKEAEAAREMEEKTEADKVSAEDSVGYETDRFSVYAIVYTIYTYVISDGGDTYKITVTYDDTAKIPENAELKVGRITEQNEKYPDLYQKANEALLNKNQKGLDNPFLFDIGIYVGNEEIEPADGSIVKVEIELANSLIKENREDNASAAETKEKEAEDSSDESLNSESETDKEEAVFYIYQGEKEDINAPDELEDGNQDIMPASQNYDIIHVLNDGNTDVIEQINTEVGEASTVLSFETKSFSDYIVNENPDRPEYRFNNIPNTLYVGETIYIFAMTNATNISVNGNNGVATLLKPVEGTNNNRYKIVRAQRAGTFTLKDNNSNTTKTITVIEKPATTHPATVSTVSNSSIGVNMNMFDYDLDDSLDDYFNQFNDSAEPFLSYFNTKGINNGHTLKFWGSGVNVDWIGDNNQKWRVSQILDNDKNKYTEYDVATNIVKNRLLGGKYGYPEIYGSSENLKYLFDPDTYEADRRDYIGVDGLFQRDSKGYYYYDSSANYAWLNPDTNKFEVYSTTYTQKSRSENGTRETNKKIGFFPFHEWDYNYDLFVNWNKSLNHHFGMSMDVAFTFPSGEMAPVDRNGEPIVFDFNGDDDMWVFIDGKLCMDIGGIHQPIDGTIDFTNRTVNVGSGTHATRQSYFTNADWDSLFDGQQHVLKVFYMERGGCDSNCKIKFNLTQYTEIDFDKVDGKTLGKLEGAKFQLYEKVIVNGQEVIQPAYWYKKQNANDRQGVKTPYIAESDENGHVKFEYVPVGEYVLKEIKAPEGGYMALEDREIPVTITKKPDGTFDVTYSISGEDADSDDEGVQVANNKPEPIDITVQKLWQNEDGSPMQTTPDEEATFTVKRIKTYVVETPKDPIESDEVTLEIWKYKGSGYNRSETIFSEYKIKHGENATIAYSYNTSYTTGWDYQDMKGYEYEGAFHNFGQNGYNGSFQISIPDTGKAIVYIYDNWKNTGYGNGTALLNLNASGPPNMIDQEPDRETITGPDNDYIGPSLTLPTAGGAWSDTFTDLPVQEVGDDDIVYTYTYYVVESGVPEGYRPVYVDGNGNIINDPSTLDRSTDGTQTIINRELKHVDVPVQKRWTDFEDSKYSWKASFLLQRMEELESGPAASDAITRWQYVDQTDVRELTKGGTLTFENMPVYRIHSNGSLYRILYSVEEIAYEVTDNTDPENPVIVAKWSREHGLEVGDERYSPQFIQDAGEDDSLEGSEDWYKIIISNTEQVLEAKEWIDLDITKSWENGDFGNLTEEEASAKFQLVRYYHEEYRDYSHVADLSRMMTVTLVVNGENKTITVPRGTGLYVEATFKEGSAGSGTVVMRRSDDPYGTNTIRLTHQEASSPEVVRSGEILIYQDNVTINITEGAGYLLDAKLVDRLPATEDAFDTVVEEFTLQKNPGNWEKNWDNLVRVEEDQLDPHEMTQTILVYSYYLREIESNPSWFDAEFTSGGKTIDENHRISEDASVLATNKPQFGSLKVKKLVSISGLSPQHQAISDENKTKADGDYFFTIIGKEDTDTAGVSRAVCITVSNGSAVSAKYVTISGFSESGEILYTEGESIALDDNGFAAVEDLIPGQYTITEIDDYKTVCSEVICTDHTYIGNPQERTIAVVVKADSDEEPAIGATFKNNYVPDDEQDIAHVSVRKTFVGINTNQIPDDFKVTVSLTVNGTPYTYYLTNDPERDNPPDGNGVAFDGSGGDGLVWNWQISIPGLRPGTAVAVEESGYDITSFTVTTAVNGVQNETGQTGQIDPSIVVESIVPHIITANNHLDFNVYDDVIDGVDVSSVFLARLNAQNGVLVISKSRLNLSERTKIEEMLEHMPKANWTHANKIEYYSLAEAADNQIMVRSRTVTYNEATKQIHFSEKCQWTMVAEALITYKPGRPADFNFVNTYKIIIDIEKVDYKDKTKKLPGAEFALRKLDEPGGNPPVPTPNGTFPGTSAGTSDPTDDMSGRTSFSGLTNGYYELTEAKTPDGYVLTAFAPVYFRIENGAVTRIEWSSSESGWKEKEDDEIVSFEDAQDAVEDDPDTDPDESKAATNVTFTIGNEPGAALPASGGPGTRLIYMLGAMLLMLGGAILLFRTRMNNHGV